MNEIIGELAGWWSSYGTAALTGLGAAGVLLIAVAAIRAKITRRQSKAAVMWLATNLGLLFNAEGMWYVLRDKAQVPVGVTITVFAVFTIMLIRAEMMVIEKFRATTVRDERGAIVRPGVYGKGIVVMWLIGMAEASVVAANSKNGIEAMLRVLIPAAIVFLFMADVKAEVTVESRGNFAYSPRRLAERWGLLTNVADQDLEKLRRDRRIAKMVTMIDVIDQSDGSAREKAVAKLRTAVRFASAEEMDLVTDQVVRARALVARFTEASFVDEAPVEAEVIEPVEVITLAEALPQPVEPELATKELPAVPRAPRGEVSEALRAAVAKIVSGYGEPEVGPGASRAVIARYKKVWRLLWADVNATIDIAAEKVREDLVHEMRAAARESRVR